MEELRDGHLDGLALLREVANVQSKNLLRDCSDNIGSGQYLNEVLLFLLNPCMLSLLCLKLHG